MEVIKSFETFDFDFGIDMTSRNIGIFHLLEGNFDKIDIVLTKLLALEELDEEDIKKLIINFSRLPIIQQTQKTILQNENDKAKLI